ncbi:ras-related and estrogen-regulated growth inhibitor-like protein [Protopterus annectens]|uniref:ras-related and estrogen-regulated growth inhibitor-like protein n=1 Tax=Protopterus annectens TaxID=7888 RepID=UPI001CFBEAB3|nr:ras-related and estrogen-regulated growth inhibitor-like protein [Protopterus annectens]
MHSSQLNRSWKTSNFCRKIKSKQRNMNDFKIALLGCEGAGKSALVVRFLTRRFIGEYASNTECFYRKRVSFDGKPVNLEIYDPCSQQCEGKSEISKVYWADGCIIVYDISDRSSFTYAKALIRKIRDLQYNIPKREIETAIFLVGTKQDLCHIREVEHEEGKKLAAENQCLFYELSAAEQYQQVVMLFTQILQSTSTNIKLKEKRRPSGSKSMAKLINNVFGKRRKSV